MTAYLLSGVVPDEHWVLKMDRTNWKLDQCILILSAAYDGIAIPLLWKFLTKEANGEEIGKRCNSDVDEKKELMEKFL